MPARFEGHTLRRFDGELNRLHEEILRMADLVTEEIQLALSTFQQPDQEILARVNEKEGQVDRLEKIIDNANRSARNREAIGRRLAGCHGFFKNGD